MKDRYQAILAGCAIGDTLGMPIEGLKKDQIKKYIGKVTSPIEPFILKDKEGNEMKEDEFGKIKFYSKGLKKGDYTDDTILTFALAESIVEKKYLDLEDISKKQLYEYVIRLNSDGSHSGGFGGTTQKGFKNLLNGISPLESGVIGGPGNAPAMKMSPLGMYMHATDKINESLEFSELISKITHLDPRSIVSGVVQAYSIFNLLNNSDKQSFINETYEICKKWEKPLTEQFPLHNKGNLQSRIEWISINKDSDIESAFKILGNSSEVYKSYPFSLFMFQKYWDNPIEGLIETINYGGDCDTTGAIFGCFAGARHGMIFPREWIDQTNGMEKALKLGEKLYEIKNEHFKNRNKGDKIW